MNKIFDDIKQIFSKNGFRLYMIGGTSRDYLLNREIDDYDFVTDATPDEIKNFLDVEMVFAKFGTVKYFYEHNKIDIVTFRVEGNYKDNRHPSKIAFVKDINEDYVRRDFTINAIYIDENYNIIDPSGTGVKDLDNKILRFIGDPQKRVEEDPLRILRGKRFTIEYSLLMEQATKNAIDNNISLLSHINVDKINEEKVKLSKVRKNIENERT